MSFYLDNFKIVYGTKDNIQGLRNKVLELAIQGKLIQQDLNDEPASELVKRIKAGRDELVKEGKIKEQKLLSHTNKEEVPLGIPDNWEWVYLKDILVIRRGASPRPIKSFITSDIQGINWIKIGDATKGGKYINSVNEKITQEGAKHSVYLKPGALIMSNSMSFGKAYILGIDGCIHDGWLSFEFDNKLLNPELLQIFLNASYKRFDEKAVGTGVRNLNIERVKETLMPIPPLAEQQRIVSKVETLMFEIDKLEKFLFKKEHIMELLPEAVADSISKCQNGEELREQLQFIIKNIETIFQIPESMQELRNVILQLAIEGKLVPQDKNDEPASELVNRIKVEKEKLALEGKIKRKEPLVKIEKDEIPFGIPKSWEWVRLDDFVVNSGQKKPDKIFTYIDVSAINNKLGVIGKELCVLKPEDAPSRARKIIECGSVIYSTVRPYLLNVAVIDNEFEYEPIVSTAFAVMNPLANCSSKYLYYFLRSNTFVNYVEDQMVGLAYPAINDDKLLRGLIPLPPVNEQHRIVQKVESIMKLIDQMENKLKRKNKFIEKMASV